ncbi:MAG: N-acetyl-gamma-glutamyl-phosphate reductase [Fibromonadaceae bacterium]|jgi:N-acetyl-gamma-glutamyl-phosphate reductase|nr:N-acetyl-gamma-glutamyl-phosphate reductase [Fibromonadaceae bacterium]
MKKVFVDGQEGTTGLQIREKLLTRKDIELLEIEPELRKDTKRRAELLNVADIAFLCLPDDAAKESVALVQNPNTIVIDTSTAHRTNVQWAYGLPELSQSHREAIQKSKRIANPGCHATGFLLAVYPLVAKGIIKIDENLSCYSVTGYSGGGKKMIAEYKENFDPSVKPYALALCHKHLPEMQKTAGLKNPPLFNPILGPYYQGMAVTVSLFPNMLNGINSFNELRNFLTDYYKNGEYVSVVPVAENPSILDPTICNNTNNAKIFVFGREEHGQITVVLDNLGKGASGAAIQNMEISIK